MKPILCTWDTLGIHSRGPEGGACKNDAVKFFRFDPDPLVYQAVCQSCLQKHDVAFHYEEISREEFVAAEVMET